MGASAAKCEGRNIQDCARAKDDGLSCYWASPELQTGKYREAKCLPTGRANLHLNSKVVEVLETVLNNKWDKDE